MATTGLGDASLWLIILVGGLGTYLIRVSFIALFGRLDDVPDGVERALRLVPAAVLSALVLPKFVYMDGSLALSPDNLRLFAGALAVAVAWYTEDILATIVAGMGALWLLSYVFG
ncbi:MULTISPECIES: AzlD domain-containing protein [unclassified Haladaptatus]|uniref:AzlD domain-containing protein n=1 Tax=unclassified Haladaptatus TaxID=2622732 RepID=UPI00209BF880|nr:MULTISPECIES: AzlD domain-containing protein [unclassified Haladaptatus]MCO8244305.1 AzlD domain-containing protein [Haladaptatus sp. AB643]MCO8254071.1 AzlD domain-containing protein [Haladaptatus sp. AB618]